MVLNDNLIDLLWTIEKILNDLDLFREQVLHPNEKLWLRLGGY